VTVFRDANHLFLFTFLNTLLWRWFYRKERGGLCRQRGKHVTSPVSTSES